jgi:hypothetical protein
MTAWARLILNSFASYGSSAWEHFTSQKTESTGIGVPFPVDSITVDYQPHNLDICDITEEDVMVIIPNMYIDVDIKISDIDIIIEQPDKIDVAITIIDEDTTISLSTTQTTISLSDTKLGVKL